MSDVFHAERTTISAVVNRDQADWLREQARRESTPNRKVQISEILRDVIALGKAEYLRARVMQNSSTIDTMEEAR